VSNISSAPLRESPVAELMPLLCADGVRAASTSGVLGDPTTATAVEGAALLAELGTALIRQVRAWQPVVVA
jgi:creatinine amidohydrolase/Fe(II)-dependent formamide hydrolase-like protein